MNAPLLRDPVGEVDAATFRAAFRRLAGGVAVVTVGAAPDRTGLTATSVSALSVEPPTLTVNINRVSSTWNRLACDGRFGVNFTSAAQRAVAERFSGFGGITGEARFEGAEWTTAVTGAPLLVGALAALDCEVEEAIDLYIPIFTFLFGEAQLRGKHSIVSLCRLHEEFYTGRTDMPLLFNRAMKEIYHELGHNFGLLHCENWECVMHASAGIEEVDIKGEFYCKKCMEQILTEQQ